jgi:hypothetical protein
LLRRRRSDFRLAFLFAALLCVASGCRTSRWQGPALAKPMFGATQDVAARLHFAESAYDAASSLESACDERCVDAYFEAAKSSWCDVRDTLDCVDHTSIRARQLYHSSLAKLVITGKQFGRFDPVRGLKIHGPHGCQHVAVNYHAFLWQPEDFNEFVLVGGYSTDELRTVYRSPGLGVPLLVKRKRNFDEPMRRREQAFSATVVLRNTPAVLRTTPAESTSQSFVLEFCDPVRVTQINLGDKTVAIRRDLSAPYAYRASTKGNVALEAFRSPGSTQNAAGLFAIEPYQPGKIPLIFVHGLLSDPTTWLAMANELRARPDILQRYQIWAFEYPTGDPFVRSARVLRDDLAEAIRILDPDGQDPALSNMVVVGHSMGGLVAKLQVTSSQTYLWDSLANRPFDQIVASDESRANLAGSLFFEPQPAIKRVIFIATPHRGAGSAQRLVGRITSSLVNEPEDRKAEHQCLIENNPGVFSQEVQNRIPTSIDMLEPKSCVLQAVERLPIASDVTLHSIIGDNGKLIGEPTDGVVPVDSARHSGVASERLICTKHTKIQSTPEAIREVLSVLRLHAQTADAEIVSTATPPHDLSIVERDLLPNSIE